MTLRRTASLAASLAALVPLTCALAAAQQDPPVAAAATVQTIATVPVEGVSLSGSLSVENGRATIGNNGTITAGDKTAHVSLTRGGNLNVCASTKIHLSTDNTTPGGALMVAIDRGAIEAHYTPGEYSDVLMTPDLRILISPPGEADISLRVNNQGDTCVDNHGGHAPYVLASSLFDGGAYRVQPNQRVLFEHGSLHEVVDNEQDPCGCPPDHPLSVASVGVPGSTPARPGEAVAHNKAEADNPFPLAESEGLKPAPAPPTTPVVPAGEAHAQVDVPLTFNSNQPLLPEKPMVDSSVTTTNQPEITAQAVPAKPHHPGFFGHIGHFFKRMFGG
ncbi:MAG TPA: hypothetical protein VFE06_17405 [Acidobacteriaceae bacterium]|jgi:hypothetical protein|nr:hypothetical protein [Acidobacteriaceae bacterium]